MREKLEQGWEWMKRCRDDDRRNAFFNDKFMPLLTVYEVRFENGGRMDAEQAVQKLLKKEGDLLPQPSPWIEELREQLTLGGIADVDPAPKRRLQE